MALKNCAKNGGRKVGTPNKNTFDMRANINAFVERNLKTAQANYNKLEPKDRLLFLEKLLKYSLPTLASVSTTVNFDSLSDQDLNKIIDELKTGSTIANNN